MTKTYIKTSVFLLAGLTAVGAVALVASSSSDTQNTSDTQSSPEFISHRSDASMQADGVTTSPAACAFEVGQVASFSWEAVDAARLDSAALGLSPAHVPPTSNTLSTSFTWSTKVLSTDKDSSILLTRMTDVSSTAVERPEILSKPFLLDIDKDCHVIGFAYHTKTYQSYARVQQGLIYDVNWTIQPRLDGSNTTGEFEASLLTSSQSGVSKTTRTISSYRVWPHSGSLPLSVSESTLTVSHGHTSWFESVSLNETLTGRAITLNRKVRAKRIATQTEDLDDISTHLSDYIWEDLLSKDIPMPRVDPTWASRREQVEAQRGVPVREALDDHIALNNANEPAQRAWPTLRAWLEANPEQTHTLVDEIKQGTMGNRAQMMAYVALGQSQTQESKDALVDILNAPQAPMIERSRAILALIVRPDVGITLAETLSQYAEPIESGSSKSERALARQAILGLSALAGHKPGDEEIRDVAVSTIRRLLDTVERPINRRPLYGAISNIGDPALLSLAADIPSHPDKDMRKAAARVFRRMDPDDSSEYLALWLGQETSPQVKRELYSTLDSQTYDAHKDPSDEVLTLAIEDLAARPIHSTRHSLIAILSRALERRPDDPLGIRPVMQGAAAYELETNSGLYQSAIKQLDPRVVSSIVDAHIPSKHTGSPKVEEPSSTAQSKNPAMDHTTPHRDHHSGSLGGVQ